jgi:flagellar L-ring protein FlgH
MRFYSYVIAALTAASAAVQADSIWVSAAAPRAIVSDRKAVAVGDILSILVQENTAASKDTSTKTAKKTGLDASISSFLFSPAASKFLTKKGQLPAIKMDSNNSFDGSGQINNNEKIIARIAVTVIDVMPNGNLVIEGSRQTAFSGETSDAILRGIVRPADIGANNTVYSYNVANATIRYVSKGAASDGARKGWFTKVWDKLTPF